MLDPLVRLGLKLLVKPLRKRDYAAAQQPDIIVSISSYIQSEIQKHYHRDSVIIAPTVAVTEIQRLVTERKSPSRRKGFIISGRQVSWKRVDLAIGACIKLNKQLLVVGDGPEHAQLVEQARGHKIVRFLPRHNGVGEIVEHFAGAKAFLFPKSRAVWHRAGGGAGCWYASRGITKGRRARFYKGRSEWRVLDEQTVDSLPRRTPSDRYNVV